jgi:hypothetical protein
MAKGAAARSVILVLVIALLAGGFWLLTRERPEERLIGTWKSGLYEIEFRTDHTFVDHGSHALPSHGEYSVDFSQNPAWINIIPRRNLAGPELTPLYYFAGLPTRPLARGLIRFKTNDEIELAFTDDYAHPNAPWATSGLGEQRPTAFQPGSGVIIITLTRMKR